LQQQPTTGNSDVATKTGSTYTSETMTYTTEIPQANVLFPTTLSSKNCPPAIATTIDNRKWQYVLGANIAISGRRRSHLTTLLSSPSWLKMPDLPLEFRRYVS